MRFAITFLMMFLTSMAFCEEPAPYVQEELNRLDRELKPLMRLSDTGDGNIARGKSYVFSEKPNMGTCTGDSDITDLTNGQSDTSESGIWFCADCVGWARKKTVSVTVDLGKSESIDRVKLYSGGGRAGVHLPAVVLVEISDDGKDFHLIGDLVALSKVALPREGIGHRVFVYEGNFAPVCGRYVRLRMRPTGQYLTITEIEVFKSETAGKVAGELPASPDDLYLLEQGEKSAMSIQMRENMLRLLDEVYYDGKGAAALKQEISHWNFEGDVSGFRGTYPTAPIQRKIFARHAERLRQAGHPEVIVQPIDFYANVSPVVLPDFAGACQLNQIMQNGEVRGAALIVCNTTAEDKNIQARLEGLEGEIYEVGYIDSEFYYPTSTFLQPHTQLCAVPGLVSELAVVFRPKGLSVGKHTGKLLLTAGQESYTVPVELEILSGEFPNRPQLVTYGWEYLDLPSPTARTSWQGMPMERFDEFRKLRNADLCYGTMGLGAQEVAACPLAIKVREDGQIITQFDFKFFDRWVKQNPDASFYGIVAIGMNWANAKFGQKLEPGTEAFDRAVESWAKAWNDHVLELGLKGRVIFQIFDEPGLDSSANPDDQYKLLQQWHTPFHRGAPDIQLYIDPCGKYEPRFNRYLTNNEIICPEAELLHGEGAEERMQAFMELHEQGHPFHIYSCSFGPFMGEPGAFRNQAWMTFRVRGVATGFWGATNVDAKTSMNRYITQQNYFSPYLLDKQGLHLTKHSFALRDGIQDFEYLTACEKLLTEAEQKGLDVKDLRNEFQAEVLTVAAERAKFRNRGQNMATRAEEARRKIIAIIRKLEAK